MKTILLAAVIVMSAMLSSCALWFDLAIVECVSNDDCSVSKPYCCGAGGDGAYCYAAEELPFACGGLVSDAGDTTPDVITDATDADGDTSPDAADADVTDTTDSGDTTPDVITDATDADGDSSPDAEDADVTDTPPICGDGICNPEEDCEADCGPRIVTLTVQVHPNDAAWSLRNMGANQLWVMKHDVTTDTWFRIAYPGETFVVSPGDQYLIRIAGGGATFGICRNIYTIPDTTCDDCIFEAPRLMYDFTRLRWEGVPGTSIPVQFTSFCVNDPSISDLVRTQLNECRGDGDIFRIGSQWVCVQPLGELGGFDQLRGSVFNRCTNPDICTDYLSGEFAPSTTSRVVVTTTTGSYTLTAR